MREKGWRLMQQQVSTESSGLLSTGVPMEYASAGSEWEDRLKVNTARLDTREYSRRSAGQRGGRWQQLSAKTSGLGNLQIARDINRNKEKRPEPNMSASPASSCTSQRLARPKSSPNSLSSWGRVCTYIQAPMGCR
jgi:hypothetical protein